METNPNLDSLEGLDSWMNQQQQQHQQMSAPSRSGFQGPGYHQMVDPARGREFLPPRNLHPPSSMDPQGHLSFQQHQSFHRVPASSHAHIDHDSHGRSAWSHLLSLEPSMTSSSSYTGSSSLPGAGGHLRDSYPPGLVKNNIGLTSSAAAMKREHPMMQFAHESSVGSTLMHNNSSSSGGGSSDLPFQSLPHDKVSQHLSQLINMSKNAANASKVPFSKPLTVSTELSSLESSGDYSPVSPPAAPPVYEDPLLNLTLPQQGKVADLLGREPHPSIQSSPHVQLSGSAGGVNPLITRAMDSNLSYHAAHRHLNAGVPAEPTYHPVPVSSTSGVLTSPSDMPLDMTTAVSGKSDYRQGNSTDQPFFEDGEQKDTVPKNDTNTHKSAEPIHSSPAAAAAFGKVPDRKDTLPLLQAVLRKTPELNHGSWKQPQMAASTSAATPVVPALSLSQDKVIKLPKSTPKKSNFYGRDASLFTFSSEDVSAGASLVTTSQNTHNVMQSVQDSKDSQSVFPEAEKSNSLITQPYHAVNSLMATSIPDDESKPLPTSFQSSVNSAGVPDAMFTNPQAVAGSDQPISSSESFSESFFDKNFDGSISVPNAEDSKEDVETKEEEPVASAEGPASVNQTSDVHQEGEANPTAELDNDAVLEPSPSAKGPKRRKRKAAGAVKKPRKQAAQAKLNAAQVPVMTPSMVVLERADLRGSPVASAQLQSMGEKDEVTLATEAVQEVGAATTQVVGAAATQVTAGVWKKPAVKRKRKAKAAPKVEGEEGEEDNSAPRRSSSRKSKDNAMRLIELQADVGYVSIPDVDDDQPPPMPKRAGRKRAAAAAAVGKAPAQPQESELSDLSEDSSSTDDQAKEKDDDYVVDEEEAALVEKGESLEEVKLNSKTFVSKKKPGSLRISIKLSGDSSAEIVSGIEDSPVKRKRKPAKKKPLKGKGKAKLNPEALANEVEPSNLEAAPEVEPSKLETTAKEEGDTQADSKLPETDKQMSLMEKYFSSATVAKQNQAAKLPEKRNLKSKKGVEKPLNQRRGKLGLGKAKGVKQKKTVQITKDDSGAKITKQEPGVAPGGNSVPKFRCGYCPQRYHSKADLMTHMDDHMAEMENKDGSASSPEKSAAPMTDKKLAGSEPVGQIKTLSQKPGPKPTPETVSPKEKLAPSGESPKFKCGECSKVFKSKPLLLDHVRIHTADKPFECDICHKCFAERTLLSSHRKTHVQENLLRCHMCSKAFIHKADLDEHMQSHPKRSLGASPPKGTVLKKAKKTLQLKPPKEEAEPQVVKKKTCFASALSGDEPGSSNGVLILKRKEATAPLAPKAKQPEGTPKIKNSVPEKSAVGSKTNSSDSQSASVGRSPRSDHTSSTGSFASVKKTSESVKEEKVAKLSVSSASEKPKQDAPSNVCTCKECPECVTRFLESFI